MLKNSSLSALMVYVFLLLACLISLLPFFTFIGKSRYHRYTKYELPKETIKEGIGTSYLWFCSRVYLEFQISKFECSYFFLCLKNFLCQKVFLFAMQLLKKACCTFIKQSTLHWNSKRSRLAKRLLLAA